MKTYKCKDNAVIIKTFYKGNVELDEIHIGVEGDEPCGFTIVSTNDLTAAIHKHITHILTDFQLDLQIAGLIPNALWDYEKVAKKYVKYNFKNYKNS